jgi:iron complex transport system substrate-binding protein
MRGTRTTLAPIAIALVLVAAGVAFAGGARVVVENDLVDVFDVLAAGFPGSTPVRVDDDAHLALRRGSVSWRDVDAVAVVPQVVLEALAEHDDAADLLRYATSSAAQRRLIAAGLLPASVTVRDQAGRALEVAQPVERLASPYSLATYLAYGVGAGDRVVMAGFLGARDPAGAAAMTRIDPRFPALQAVATQETTSAEFIARVAPDLVFAAARSDWIGPVEALGIPVVVIDGESADGLRGAMRLAGTLLGPDAAARAEAWVQYYDHVLARVADAIAGRERPSVLFTGTTRTTVASGAMYQSALIAAAGGTSVTAALAGHWNEVGLEQVLVWNPELILVPPYGGASVEAILDDPEWGLLDAVRAGAVARVPKLVAPWDTPVPDSVLAVVWLAERLHPGRVDLSCDDEVAFFYRRFYGYAIGPEEVADLCRR